jgi:threonine dehydrogenase-like Zn-dependent dehydrogenase
MDIIMPKRLICVQPNELAWQEYDEPRLSAGQVRVRCAFGAAKHGTEMSIFKGYGNVRGVFDSKQGIHDRERSSNPYPCGLGNMNVGAVMEVGDGVSQLSEGDRVLCYGGFRQTQVIHENACWKLPPAMSWKSAVCLDPADFALGAVRDGNARIGDAVAVFSLGAIGLMAVQFLRLAGAMPIIAVDPIESRRDSALSLGADIALDPTACDAGGEIRRLTDWRGADVVIEYSGSRQAMQDALRGVAFGGTVVAGAYPPPYSAGLDFGAEAHLNRPNIVFSRACSDPNRDHPRWDNSRIYDVAFKLLSEGRLSGDAIVQPVVKFEELLTAYPKIASDPASTLKLGVEY